MCQEKKEEEGSFVYINDITIVLMQQFKDSMNTQK